MQLHEDLIYDIGVNKGEDSEFYLRKGFRVVGIDANPVVCLEAARRLNSFIKSGQYVLLNAGLHDQNGSMPFYVNLAEDHWSSFDKGIGTRDNSPFEVIDVPCVTLRQMLETSGVPRYMKVDIEGFDARVVRQLLDIEVKPKFISVEEYGHRTIDELVQNGYTHFKFVSQHDKDGIKAPQPPREGQYVDMPFHGRNTGLFGHELLGDWVTAAECHEIMSTRSRTYDNQLILPEGHWYDIHAALPSAIDELRPRDLLRMG